MKVRFIYNYANRPAFNVWYLKFSGAIADLATMNGILAQVATVTTTNIKPLYGPAASMTTIEGTDLTTRTGVVSTVTGSGAGSRAGGAALPNSVAFCVSLNVAFRYRGGHARMYLPAQGVSDILGGISWASTYPATVQAGVNSWRSGINAMTGANSPFALVMVSYFTHDANHNPMYHPDSMANHIYPISNVTAHTRVDSQRRRLGKETT
jgi:hypothetical protein